MRKTCLVCVRKHLTQAMILLMEAKKTEKYAWHKWIAYGHLAEAEDECCKKYPGFASNIRQNRLKIESDDYDNLATWFKETILKLTDEIKDEEQY